MHHGITKGRKKRIFVIAPIELLKTLVVFDLVSLSRYIRSLSYPTAVSSKIQDVNMMLI